MSAATRTRRTAWIEPENLEYIEQHVLPNVLQEPERWKSLTYPWGHFHIERLTYDLVTGECVMLNRFIRESPSRFDTGSLREPAAVERILAGKISMAICKPKKYRRGPRSFLHSALFPLGPGSMFAIRSATRLSYRMDSDRVLSVMVTRNPPIVDEPKLPLAAIMDLLHQFRQYYPV